MFKLVLSFQSPLFVKGIMWME